MTIEAVLRVARQHLGGFEGDWFDWLCYSVTNNMLIAAATIIGYKALSEKPIECVPPSFFPDSWTTIFHFLKIFIDLL
ncbi:unnamed protein product [Nippostrongylus brasiliensis]|uniref:Innexin n=1 Tax=Nippostrongylus brasiliensis TaxID=27835 RepID=A0A0N4YN67_NIPBR|nr:unnamed protein product [Nippostrongylus brasiliensis]